MSHYSIWRWCSCLKLHVLRCCDITWWLCGASGPHKLCFGGGSAELGHDLALGSLGFCCFQSRSLLILNIGLFIHDLDFLRAGKRHLPAKTSAFLRDEETLCLPVCWRRLSFRQLLAMSADLISHIGNGSSSLIDRQASYFCFIILPIAAFSTDLSCESEGLTP